ncbi:hypothetical protein J6590_029975 [Homalodisca vitripennis]|nr:hypothetical protein J6590_029975 [Homalodisca vitripennis]
MDRWSITGTAMGRSCLCSLRCEVTTSDIGDLLDHRPKVGEDLGTRHLPRPSHSLASLSPTDVIKEIRPQNRHLWNSKLRSHRLD